MLFFSHTLFIRHICKQNISWSLSERCFRSGSQGLRHLYNETLTSTSRRRSETILQRRAGVEAQNQSAVQNNELLMDLSVSLKEPWLLVWTAAGLQSCRTMEGDRGMDRDLRGTGGLFCSGLFQHVRSFLKTHFSSS